MLIYEDCLRYIKYQIHQSLYKHRWPSGLSGRRLLQDSRGQWFQLSWGLLFFFFFFYFILVLLELCWSNVYNYQYKAFNDNLQYMPKSVKRPLMRSLSFSHFNLIQQNPPLNFLVVASDLTHETISVLIKHQYPCTFNLIVLNVIYHSQQNHTLTDVPDRVNSNILNVIHHSQKYHTLTNVPL